MDISETLGLVIGYTGLTPAKFAEKIGVKTKQTVYDILKGRTQTFSKSVQDKILSCYPEINRTWLLAGEGPMLKEVDAQKEQATEGKDFKLLPLINIDSVGGMHSDNEITDTAQYTERMVPFPEAREGDIAIYESGDSMAPSIVKGSIMQIRRVERWQEYFGYGQIYVIELMDGRRITKKICKSKEDAKKFVLCHSFNPTVDDEELPREMIKEVWKVVQVLNNFGF